MSCRAGPKEGKEKVEAVRCCAGSRSAGAWAVGRKYQAYRVKQNEEHYVSMATDTGHAAARLKEPQEDDEKEVKNEPDYGLTRHPHLP